GTPALSAAHMAADENRSAITMSGRSLDIDASSPSYIDGHTAPSPRTMRRVPRTKLGSRDAASSVRRSSAAIAPSGPRSTNSKAGLSNATCARRSLCAAIATRHPRLPSSSACLISGFRWPMSGMAAKRAYGKRTSVVALEDEPAERPQADLALRVRHDRVEALPGRFDELARIALAGVERAAFVDQADGFANHALVGRTRGEDVGEPAALVARQAAHRLGDRRRDLAGRDVLAFGFSILIEAAQVEHIVDDLERHSVRLEQPADGVGLLFRAAADERRRSRERAGRRGRLQPVDREHPALEERPLSALDDVRQQRGESVDVERLAGMRRADGLEV